MRSCAALPLFDRPTARQHPPHHLSSDRESRGFGRGGVMELVGKAPSFTPLSLLFQAARASEGLPTDEAPLGPGEASIPTQTFLLTSVTPGEQGSGYLRTPPLLSIIKLFSPNTQTSSPTPRVDHFHQNLLPVVYSSSLQSQSSRVLLFYRCISCKSYCRLPVGVFCCKTPTINDWNWTQAEQNLK